MHVNAIPILSRIGWIGVDLFFVLSGFLISRLLFTEASRTGGIRIGRFYLRRAFKIYPVFWLLLAMTPFVLREPVSGKQWATELLFLQSYFDGIWGITWSLAVEEHFYLLLPALLAFLFRIGAENGFSRLPLIAGALMAICAFLRFQAVMNLGPGPMDVTSVLRSHVRMDELFVGVVIGYWFTYCRDAAVHALKRWHLPLASLMPAAIVIILTGSRPLVLSIGLMLLSAGFGAVVLTAACAPHHGAGPLERVLAHIGRSSYALYLWHIPVFILFTRVTGLAPTRSMIEFAAYLGVLISFSIVLTRLFEDPILAFRDRNFPSTAAKALRTQVAVAAH